MTRRSRTVAPDPEPADPFDRADAWAPAVGFGYWRAVYGGCCDALLAYDRITATMPPGPLRGKLVELRPELPARLARAARLAEVAALLFPAGPAREPALLALLADDPLDDLSRRLSPVPPDPGLREALLTAREELWRVAEDAARLAVRVWENPTATDVPAWLTGLAGGVATALAAGVPGPCHLEDEL